MTPPDRWLLILALEADYPEPGTREDNMRDTYNYGDSYWARLRYRAGGTMHIQELVRIKNDLPYCDRYDDCNCFAYQSSYRQDWREHPTEEQVKEWVQGGGYSYHLHASEDTPSQEGRQSERAPVPEAASVRGNRGPSPSVVILDEASVHANGVDISNHVTGITVNIEPRVDDFHGVITHLQRLISREEER